MVLRRVILCCILLSALLSIACPRLSAQFTSSFEGTVADPSGAVVAGATVTLKNEETGATQTLETSDSGYFRFTALPSAAFKLTVTAKGFKTTVQEHIRVEVAETKTVNLSLSLGGTDVVVTVTEEAPAVETSQGRISGEIEEQKVHDLPLSGRNFYTLVVLTPGVTGLASGGGQAYAQASGDIFNPEYGVNLNANGARAESNSFLIDSASIDSSQRNGVTNVNPNAEDVQEVRVASNNFSAEYGRNAAALVNIITKQGSNNWHGTLGFYHTDNKLQARNEFQSAVPVFRRNEGAWSFGGPIRRDKTFFFASMDILKSGVAFGRDASVATPDFINFMQQNNPNNISTSIWKNFPSSVTPTKDFITAGQMAGVDCSTLSSPSATISTEVGNIPCNLNVTGVGSFATGLPRNGFQWTARLDHNFRDGKDRLFASVNRTTLHQVLFGSPSVYPGFNTIEPTYSIHFATGWVHATTGGLVNEFGFATTRPYGEALVNHPEVPGISVIGIEGIQTGWGPNAFVQNNFEWRDVASLTRGRHSLKVGGRVTRERADHESSRVYNRPQFSFASVFDFAADKPFSEGNIGFDPVTGEHLSKLFSLVRTGSLAGFVQDDWKIKPNLTINIGLRYENLFNPSDAQGDTGISGITFPSGTDFVSRVQNMVMVEKKHLFNSTMNTWSPRLSFAWDPTKEGKMSVRAGIGVFYDRPSNQLYDGMFANTPRVAVTSASQQTAPFLPVFSLGATPSPPYNYPFPAGLQTGLNAQGGLLHGLANVIVADPNLRTSYVENWFFGVQRSLTPTLTLEGDYIGSVGRHLYTRYNVNRFDGDLIQHGGQYTGLVPGFADVDLAQSSENSAYHGLSLSVKKRAGHGLTFDGSYTYSKAIDQASKLDATEHAEVLNDARERGLADFDVRHRLAFTTLWQVPSPHVEGLANKVLGGWELTNVTILQAGQPFSVICTAPFPTCDFNADGINMDYPNVPSFGSTKTGLSRSDYLSGMLKPSDFPTPAAGQEGNLGRNTFRGPGFANTDFSVVKNFKIPWFIGSEGAKVQFRTEFFNVFNRVNLTQVTNDLSNPQFGRSTGAYPARDIQFALRIAF